MSTFLVFFELISDRYDGGQEYVEARSKKGAIDTFREYYPKDKYRITAIYKQLSL